MEKGNCFLSSRQEAPRWLLVSIGCSILVLVLLMQTKGGQYITNDQYSDKFLGDLLSSSFDEASCLSRYESAMYWKVWHGKPSSYLLEKLRTYEALHKKCGPNTEMYNKSINQLKSNSSKGPLECNYVVWMPDGGLGNVIMTIVSSFLYALISNKVLLLQIPEDLQDLFCEPFPGTSWRLPSDFPVKNLNKYFDNNMRFGRMVKDNELTEDLIAAANASLPPYAYLYLRHNYDKFDMLFFCDEAQSILQKFPWLTIKSNNYFLPGLFLISNKRNELNQMFPQKERVFHYLSRYLVHPSNKVWGDITRYHDTYLADARQRVGIQIRTYEARPISYEQMLAQLLNCTFTENILPEVSLEVPFVRGKSRAQSRAVIVTNLNSVYHDKLRDMYYEHSTTTGELVGVFQPSNEEHQQSAVQNHNAKALSEMYLLSFSDVLVTSAWSTFGYVAQGLAGFKPWILLGPQGKNISCLRAMSMEPCFHNPPTCDCKGEDIDNGNVVSNVRHCEDVAQGLKLFD